jgi:hypothetical protein
MAGILFSFFGSFTGVTGNLALGAERIILEDVPYVYQRERLD